MHEPEHRPAPEHGETERAGGVEGMKERAELLGGTLRAGRTDGGWMVEATLPGPDGRQKKKWC